MKITEFVKKELTGWKIYEAIGLFSIISFILVNAFFVKDNPIAVCSAICGILYTIIAGKGKISCYFFGLLGSGCYIWLSFKNALWGNMLLYLCYYIPMQIVGIFKWKKHLENKSNEIIKTKLSHFSRLKLFIIGTLGCIMTVFILAYFNDKNPVIDGITTFLSILGMYLTVRRCIEQWIIWGIVNGLSFVMWLNLVIHGTKAFSTVIMWGVYFILAIYFYTLWKKELNKS
jgi:nicotinamide mononucleotide transporter